MLKDQRAERNVAVRAPGGYGFISHQQPAQRPPRRLL